MEFKIAVIGKKMFGDLGLIINDPNRPPQKNKGFHDNELTEMLRGAGNNSATDIIVKDK